MKKIITFLLLLVSLNASAEMVIETIQLLHRTSDEVIPMIRPMMDPKGSLSGRGYKLIIKSTPDNISQIRAILDEIDTNPNMLKVYVSYTKQSNENMTGGSVSFEAGNKNARVNIGRSPNTPGY